ncbi:hypothetical protein [Gracilimonas sp.]|uniref:hypothetical protein n=1 Tax=Gracilimonas sp. TaxID=1974203 RepID=UPI0028718C18|nr:hypothetical protein [Gracilimonas sp.]
MKKLFVLVLAVLFSFDAQAQHLESITGGISFISNQNTDLRYDGRIPGIETGVTFLVVPAKAENGLAVIGESKLRYWTEALKSDHYSQLYTCQGCSVNEQAAISLTTEIGVRNRITVFHDFYFSFLTGLNYELRFFNDPDFTYPEREYREFNIGGLAKVKVSSFLTNRAKVYLSWQSAFYKFQNNDLPDWSMPTLSAGFSYSLN